MKPEPTNIYRHTPLDTSGVGPALMITVALIVVIAGTTFWLAGKKAIGFALLALFWLAQLLGPFVPHFTGLDAFALVSGICAAAIAVAVPVEFFCRR